jgi:hypothetical protein
VRQNDLRSRAAENLVALGLLDNAIIVKVSADMWIDIITMRVNLLTDMLPYFSEFLRVCSKTERQGQCVFKIMKDLFRKCT